MEAMASLDKNHMEELKLAKEEKTDLEIFYSAHTDYMNPEAKVVFIGICPGFEQMQLSFNIVKEGIHKPEEQVLREAKVNARFGKSMRKNLIDLADQTLLPHVLGLSSTQALFDPESTIMDNTCLIPYPVFHKQKNYTGHSPKINRSPLLKAECEKQLRKIAQTYPHALFIPLGKCVDEQVSQSHILDENRILHGFPHPSGANGHRFDQLKKNRDQINQRIEQFFKNERDA